MSRPPFPPHTDERAGDPDGRRGGAVGAAGLRALTGPIFSLPALALWLVAVTVLAAGPLQALDRALSQPWSRFVLPDLRPFFVHVVDSMADPIVAMITVSVVSLVVARRTRSLRPLIVTGAAVSSETALVVSLKLLTARPRPMSGEPSFFHFGMENATIYPSGHTANAILIYGIAVYLIATYTRAEQRTITALCWTVAFVGVVATLTSLYLQWHWATDLIGGFVAGGLVLRATITLDHTYPAGAWRPLHPLLWRLELLTCQLTRVVQRIPAEHHNREDNTHRAGDSALATSPPPTPIRAEHERRASRQDG